MVKHLSTYLLVIFPFLGLGQIEYELTEVPIPMEGNMYAPAIYNNQFVICSNRKNRISRTVLDKYNQEPIDLYLVDPTQDFTVTSFDPTFTTDFHDGPISFDASSKHCVISRNIHINKKYKTLKEETNLLGLFEYHRIDDQWSEPIPLPFNDSNYTCTHPALSPDGNTLIFASNMPGGNGGFDIWKAEKINDTWSSPVNLGSNVNTSANEFFPSFVNNEIYFSANRNEIGGFDIYRVTKSRETLFCELLRQPINSISDDFGITSIDNFKSGYFSSNRSGNDRIWSFESQYPKFEDCDSLLENDFCYTLYEENAYELGSVESLVYEWNINGIKRQGIEIDYCFPGAGTYEVSLDIIDTIINTVYSNQAYYVLEIVNDEQPYITAPDTVHPGQLFTLDPTFTNLPNVEIQKYYWDLSDETKYEGKYLDHSFKKVGNYTLTLGIIGTKNGEPFSDCVYRGIVCTDTPVEQKQQAKRSSLPEINEDAVLEVKNISLKNTDSLEVIHSIRIDESPVELSDTNERIAPLAEQFGVKHIYLEEDSTFIYYIGEWSNIDDAYETWIKIIGMGYDDISIFEQYKDIVEAIPVNQVFSLDNIEFDVNKWEIRPEAAKELIKLVNIMNDYVDLDLTIAAHTDNVGSNENNLVLSQQRAKAILEHLVQEGISQERMTSEGFGETIPIKTNETIEDRQENRRVEFIFISQKLLVR